MEANTKKFTEHLKKHNFFATNPRLQLFKTLMRHSSMSMNELIESLPKQDKSSVYRNVELLEKLGIIHRVRLGWKSKYELSDLFHDHHHHLTCLRCEKVIVIDEDLVIEQELQRLSFLANFKAIDHTLEIRGLCSDCA